MERVSKGPAYQAYLLLKLVFIIFPIVAGLDNFFSILTDRNHYLGVELEKYSEALQMIVGAIEVIIGIGVIYKPKVFSYIIGTWLILVMINLIYLGGFFDMVLKDAGLCLSAFAFARLAKGCTEGN